MYSITWRKSLLFHLIYTAFAYAVSFATELPHLFSASGNSKKRVVNMPENPQGRVMVGYVRQSMQQDAEDVNSKARQIANLQEMAQKFDFKLELYIDVGGHRSGRDLKSRPEWARAERRLSDPDVCALGINDLSRAHRKGWRIGQLLDLIEQRGQTLVLARDRHILDLSTPKDRFIAAFMAMADQWYADDIAERQRDSIRRRHLDGLTVAMPPAGTIRNSDGFLMLSPRGAWLLSDGRVQSGERDIPPEADAIWRGYADAVHFVLDTYCNNHIGAGNLARLMRQQGWFVRNRNGNPRLPTRDDVRRILAAWPQYAGLVVQGRSKDRRKGDIRLDWADTGRSVFPLALLRRVAHVEHERRLSRASGSVSHAYPYSLRAFLYCEQCERRVDQPIT